MVVDYSRQIKSLRQRQIGKTSRKYYLIFGGVFLFLAGFIYLLFYAKLFDIKSISVTTEGNITAIDIENISNSWLNSDFLGVKYRSNYYLFRPDKLTEVLRSKLIAANLISVSRNGHDILINVKERKPVGIWCFSKKNNCYYFDEDGVAYEETGKTEGYIFSVINDERERSFSTGDNVESKEWINKMFSTKALLMRNGLDISEFIIPDRTVDEFMARTSVISGSERQKSWLIMLSIATDIGRQISAFVNFFNTKMTAEEKEKLEYIDLRIDGRLYYK